LKINRIETDSPRRIGGSQIKSIVSQGEQQSGFIQNRTAVIMKVGDLDNNALIKGGITTQSPCAILPLK
jgi:hypothetical protein